MDGRTARRGERRGVANRRMRGWQERPRTRANNGVLANIEGQSGTVEPRDGLGGRDFSFRADRCVRAEGIDQPTAPPGVGGGRDVSISPCTEGGRIVAVEGEKIGGAIEIDVDDGANAIARFRIERFDDVEAAVTVTVELALHERAANVLLFPINSAIEVGVAVDPDGPARVVPDRPDVWSAVGVEILDVDDEAADGRNRRRHRAAENQRDATSKGEPCDSH